MEPEIKNDGTLPPTEPSHDTPIRTEKEKAEFSLKKNAEKVRELGGDPDTVLGRRLNIDEDLPDDTPLTVGALRDIQRADVKKTALALADEIPDELEREEVKKALERVAPSDNPHADLAFARGAVNETRSRQIAEDVNRRTNPSRTASGGSAPAKTEDEFTPTDEETVFMAPPYNLSKEKILAQRKKE